MPLPQARPKLPERPDGWRVGDVVVVRADHEVTNLGEGVVVDVLLGTEGYVKQVLVRFDEGPAAGVWYGTPMLTPLRDLEGRPLTPSGLYAVPERRRREPAPEPKSVAPAPMPRQRLPEPQPDYKEPKPLLSPSDLVKVGLLTRDDPCQVEFAAFVFEAQKRGEFHSRLGAIGWARKKLVGEPLPGSPGADRGFAVGAIVRVINERHSLFGREGRVVLVQPPYLVVTGLGPPQLYFRPENLELVGQPVAPEPEPFPEWLAVGVGVRVVAERSSFQGKQGTVSGFNPPYVLVEGMASHAMAFEPSELEPR